MMLHGTGTCVFRITTSNTTGLPNQTEYAEEEALEARVASIIVVSVIMPATFAIPAGPGIVFK